LEKQASKANLPVSGWENLPMRHVARKQAKQRKRPRRLSCFTRGVIAITVALLQAHALPVGFFAPFEWPGGKSGSAAVADPENPYP